MAEPIVKENPTIQLVSPIGNLVTIRHNRSRKPKVCGRGDRSGKNILLDEAVAGESGECPPF
jgi:hypothetical protein